MFTLYFLILIGHLALSFKVASLVEYYTDNTMLSSLTFICMLVLPVTIFLDLTV
jgi:hypothetical protein